MSLKVPFSGVEPLSTPAYGDKTASSQLRLQTTLSSLCPKRVTLSVCYRLVTVTGIEKHPGMLTDTVTCDAFWARGRDLPLSDKVC